jgi:hypothetical protein
MGSLKKQRIENQINKLITPHFKNFKGMVYRTTDTFSDKTEFTKEFLDQIPIGIKTVLDDLVKELNAS